MDDGPCLWHVVMDDEDVNLSGKGPSGKRCHWEEGRMKLKRVLAGLGMVGLLARRRVSC